MFPSRSEAIRQALRDFLKCELEMVESLLDLSEKEGKIQVVKDPKTKTKKIDMRSIRAGWEGQPNRSFDKQAARPVIKDDTNNEIRKQLGLPPLET